MSTAHTLAKFLTREENRDIAVDVIRRAATKYDNDQDLIRFKKRNIYVHRDAGSAMLLETIIGDDEQEVTVEPTFVVAGSLVKANLPPVRTRNQIHGSILSAAQEVSITAADLIDFNEAIVAIQDVHDLFALEFAQGALVRSENQTVDGELALTFATRYFTGNRLAGTEPVRPLTSAVDPVGILERAVAGKGKHLIDNKVDYFRFNTSRGSKVWEAIQPSRFREGQTVQLEVGFRVVPTSSKASYRMVALLRSVTLLDSQLYAAWEQVLRTRNAPTNQIRYKRTTAYDVDDEEGSVFRPNKKQKAEDNHSVYGGNVEDAGNGGDGAEDASIGEDDMPFAYDDLDEY